MDVFSALTMCSVLSMHYAFEEMYTQKGNWSQYAVFPAKLAALMQIATFSHASSEHLKYYSIVLLIIC